MDSRNLARKVLKRLLAELEDRGRTTYKGVVRRVNIYDKYENRRNPDTKLEEFFFPKQTVLTYCGVGQIIPNSNSSSNVFASNDPITKKKRVCVRINGEGEIRAIEVHKIFSLEVQKNDGTKHPVVPTDYDYLIGSLNQPVKFTVSTRNNALLTDLTKSKLRKYYLISRTKNGYVVYDRLRTEGFLEELLSDY